MTLGEARPCATAAADGIRTSNTSGPAGEDVAVARAMADAAALSRSMAAVVVEPPGPGVGSWAGAPTALLVDGTYYLAYRLRRPIGHGRGFANVIARSGDGVAFETIAVLNKARFGAASLERPALVVTDDGRWRLYVSCATSGSAHWRVDLVEASSPAGLADGDVGTVLPGSQQVAVKDPVVVRARGCWHLWASCHPLTDPQQADRMTTAYATSEDGVHWTWRGTALRGRPGSWDQRGVRVTAVLLDGATPVAYYDGRASATQNFEEQTGVAVGASQFGTFRAVDQAPVARSAYGGRGLRYVSVVSLPDRSRRLYYEATRADGAHDLRTVLRSAAS